MVDAGGQRGPLPFDESPSPNAPKKDALRYPSATCRALASNVFFWLLGGMLSFFLPENDKINGSGQVKKRLSHSKLPRDFCDLVFYWLRWS